MRPILPGDLDQCVRALLLVPSDDRPTVMRGLLQDAETADVYRKRFGRLHLLHGDGSLMSAAWSLDRDSLPSTCDEAYCSALSVVIDEIALWRHQRQCS